jgi:hypothetical protein
VICSQPALTGNSAFQKHLRPSLNQDDNIVIVTDNDSSFLKDRLPAMTGEIDSKNYERRAPTSSAGTGYALAAALCHHQ